VTVLLSMLLALAVASWIWGRWGSPVKPARTRRISAALALLLTASALTLGLNAVSASVGAPDARAAHSEWEPYTEALVSDLLTQGRPFFIDFTADWCLSCKVNERVALDAEPVRQKFDELGVTLVKADWTRRSEEITRALAAFGRSSVPLYVLYPGGAQAEPLILPEIITPSTVLEALHQIENRSL
jgi:thiol:disulfide interchange protein DsbD